MRDGRVRAAQCLWSQGRRQGTGIPNFQPVFEEHDLDAGVAGVVAMHDGVDDGFGDDLLGDFVFRGNPCAFFPCSDPKIDLGEDEILGLIDEIEDRAFVNLVGRNGLCHFTTVEVGALDLGGDQEPLWLFAKQQNGGVGRTPLVEEVEVRQHLVRRSISRQWKMATTTRKPQETGDLGFVQVIQGGVAAERGIEGTDTDEFALFENPDQAGIHGGDEFFRGIEATPNEVIGHSTDQCPHFRVLRIVGLTLYEDQAAFSEPGGFLVFEMSGGKPGLVFPAIIVTEQADVDVAVPDFVEIDFIRPTIGCGHIMLEEEGLEEALQ